MSKCLSAVMFCTIMTVADRTQAAVVLKTGSGRDGAWTVSSNTSFDSRVARARMQSYDTASRTVSLSSTVGTFGVGDEVLLLDMDGSDGGSYEFVTVSAISGSSLTFNRALTRSFSGVVQVQQVPHFTDVTINARLNALPYSAATPSAGLIAFRASGLLSVGAGGSIDVDAAGYVGGVGGAPGSSSGFAFGGNTGASPTSGSYLSQTGSGGGGGGGATSSGWGGGGGAHRTAGANASGFGGVVYGDEMLDTLHPGAGGGGGAGYKRYWRPFNGPWRHSNYTGGTGGAGGGIVYIAAETMDVDGLISARGGNGATATFHTGSNTSNSQWGGGGAGGAGGSIFLQTNTASFSVAPSVAGGVGLTNSYTSTGGAGGSGYYRFDYASAEGDYAAYSGFASQPVYIPEPSMLAGVLLAGGTLLRRRGRSKV